MKLNKVLYKIFSIIKDNKYEYLLCFPRYIYTALCYSFYKGRLHQDSFDKIIVIKKSNHTNECDIECQNSESLRIMSNEQKLLFYNTKDRFKDIKYDWEKQRYHSLIWEVALTQNAESQIRLIENNIASHKFLNTNAMEVSIALINVIEACKKVNSLCIASLSISKFIRKSLTYIFDNYEKAVVYSTNHYFFNLIGALWALNYCNILNKCKARKFLYDELCSLLNQIINNDGSLYEESTYYHRYVTESLLEYVYFNNACDDKIIRRYIDSMMEFIHSISDNGRIFGFGDNDSGRILAIPSYYSYSSRNIQLINNIYKMTYNTDFMIKESNICYKKDFGIIVYKNDIYSFALRCKEGTNRKKNKYIGGHAHNDFLSIEINFYHIPIVVNRGTYLYIPDENYRYRNLMTKNHSVLSFEEGIEQNDISNNWIPQKKTQYCKVDYLSNKIVDVSFLYKCGTSHRRHLEMDSNELIIIDEIFCENNKGKIRYYLSSNVSPSLGDKCVQLKTKEHTILLCSDEKISLKECTIYPEYGQIEKSYMIEININKKSVTSIKCID